VVTISEDERWLMSTPEAAPALTTMDVLRTIDEESRHITESRIIERFREARIVPIDLGTCGPEVLADVHAWAMSFAYHSDEFCWTIGHGEPQPESSLFADESLLIWGQRAASFSHPMLIARYAHLIWAFGKNRVPNQERMNAARAASVAYFEAAQEAYCPDVMRATRPLCVALHLACSVGEQEQIDRCVDGLIEWAGEHAKYHQTGTWALLDRELLQVKAVKLNDERRSAIFAVLERMLTDARGGCASSPDPHPLLEATEILARHYRRVDPTQSAALVEDTADRVRKCVEDHPKIPSSRRRYWLEQARTLTRSFQCEATAKGLLSEIERVSRELPGEMVKFSGEITIHKDEIEAMASGLVDQNDLTTTLGNLVIVLLPRRAAVEQRAKEAEQNPVSALYAPTHHDADGRRLGVVGGFADDLDGRAILQLRHELDIACGTYYPLVLKLVFEKAEIDYDVLCEWLQGSLSFSDPRRWAQLKEGVRAFFQESSIVCLHVLVPQIEAGIRWMVGEVTGTRLRSNTAARGPDELRLLASLLSDPAFVAGMGEDVRWYLEAVLIDSRGFNLRNDVCHGLRVDSEIGQRAALMAFHIVLLLGLVRLQQ